MGLTTSEAKATYAQIRKYVSEKFGTEVSFLYIGFIIDVLKHDKMLNADVEMKEQGICDEEEKLCADDILKAISFQGQYFIGELYTL